MAIFTIKLEKNILLDNITFSFLLTSLYFGSLIKMLAKNINNVTIKLMVPFNPDVIPFPINASLLLQLLGFHLLCLLLLLLG